MKGYLKHWHLVLLGALLLTTIASVSGLNYLHSISYVDIDTSMRVISYLVKISFIWAVLCFLLLTFIILYRKFKTKNEKWFLKEKPNKLGFMINMFLWILIIFTGVYIINLPTSTMFNSLSFYQSTLSGLKDFIIFFLCCVGMCNIAYLYALYISNKQNNLKGGQKFME